MFLKVFKYDLRAMGKALFLAPVIWLLGAISSLLIRMTDRSDMGLIKTVLTTPLVLSVVLIFLFPLVVLVLCLRRYYTHFFTDEGYLTFTLPVKRETHLLSATLSTVAVTLLSGLAVIIALAIFTWLLPGNAREVVDEAWKILGNLWDYYSESGARVVLIAILAALSLLVSFVNGITVFHFSLTCGHLAARKHKVLAAIGIWWGITYVMNSISQVLNIFDIYYLSENDAEEAFANGLILTLVIRILLNAAFLAASYLINRHLLKNRFSLA